MNPLIVAGFHRSGTSAIARSLHLAGLHLGDDLLGSEPSNPHGHFEDNEVIAIHQHILEVNGTDWKSHEPFNPYVPEASWIAIGQLVRRRTATGRPWGFKDPRVCLLLPLWLHVLPSARVLVVFRNPGEVVRSLHMRHSRQLAEHRGPGDVHRDFWAITDLAVRMWINYHRTLLAALPSFEHVHVVDFGDRSAVASVAKTVETQWSLGLKASMGAGLDPDLGQGSVDPVRVIDPSLVDDVDELWHTLRQLAARSAGAIRPRASAA